jgi:hypothetical protein
MDPDLDPKHRFFTKIFKNIYCAESKQEGKQKGK